MGYKMLLSAVPLMIDTVLTVIAVVRVGGDGSSHGNSAHQCLFCGCQRDVCTRVPSNRIFFSFCTENGDGNGVVFGKAVWMPVDGALFCECNTVIRKNRYICSAVLICEFPSLR